MKFDRRSFFAAMGIAPAVAATLPEIANATAIKLDPETAYVLECDERLTDAQFDSVNRVWKEVLGPNAPRVLILEGGLHFPRPTTVINMHIDAMDAKTFTEVLRVNQSHLPDAIRRSAGLTPIRF